MVIGAGRCRCGCCIRGSRGGRAEGARRLGVEFSGKLVDAGEGAAERGEVHHVRIGMIGGVMDSSSRASRGPFGLSKTIFRIALALKLDRSLILLAILFLFFFVIIFCTTRNDDEVLWWVVAVMVMMVVVRWLCAFCCCFPVLRRRWWGLVFFSLPPFPWSHSYTSTHTEAHRHTYALTSAQFYAVLCFFGGRKAEKRAQTQHVHTHTH